MQICTKCKEEQPLSAFTKDRHAKNGLARHCRTCKTISSKAWRAKNPKKSTESTRKWKKRNICKWGKYQKSWHRKNRKRLKEYSTQYRAKNPHVERNSHWKCQGIINSDGTFFRQPDFEQWLKTQKGLCKICGSSNSGLSDALAVDHDHTTGIVRGLLCRKCNLSLSGFEDNPLLLASAIRYLSEIPSNQHPPVNVE